MRPHQWYSTWAILAMIAAPLGVQAQVLTRLEAARIWQDAGRHRSHVIYYAE